MTAFALVLCVHAWNLTAATPVPTITSISPTSCTVGGTAFTLTVNGTNFNSDAVVQWAGVAQTTTVVSGTQLTAAIAAPAVATAGAALVKVSETAGTTKTLSFTIMPLQYYGDSLDAPAAKNPLVYANAGMRRVGKGALKNQDGATCVALDETNGFAYVGTTDNSDATTTDPIGASIVKMNIAVDYAAPVPVATLNSTNDATLADLGAQAYVGAVVDATHQYAAFIADSGELVKIRLDTFAVVNVLTLDAGGLLCIGLDKTTGFAYAASQITPGVTTQSVVYKVDLGTAPGTAATLVGSLALTASGSANEGNPGCIAIDSVNHFAFLGTGTRPGKVVKLDLSAASFAASHVGVITLMPSANEDYLSSAVLDTAAGYGYFGTGTASGSVVKVCLGTVTGTFGRTAGITLNKQTTAPALPDGLDNLQGAVIDPTARAAYFATGGSADQAYLVKIDLGTGAAIPSAVDVLPLAPVGESPFFCMASDARGYAYLGTRPDAGAGALVKVALSTFGTVHGTKVTVANNCEIRNVAMFTNTADAAVRVKLALYDNNSPRGLIWASAPLTPTGTAPTQTVSVDLRADPSGPIVLAKGVYWLCWQTNTSAPVVSYKIGKTAETVFFCGSYVAGMPTKLNFPTILTAEHWEGGLVWQNAATKVGSTFTNPITMTLEPKNPLVDGLACCTWTPGATQTFTLKVFKTNGGDATHLMSSYRGKITIKLGAAGKVPVPYSMTVDDAGQKDFTVSFQTPGAVSVTATDGIGLSHLPSDVSKNPVVGVVGFTSAKYGVLATKTSLPYTVNAAGPNLGSSSFGYTGEVVATDPTLATYNMVLGPASGKITGQTLDWLTTTHPAGGYVVKLTATATDTTLGLPPAVAYVILNIKGASSKIAWTKSTTAGVANPTIVSPVVIGSAATYSADSDPATGTLSATQPLVYTWYFGDSINTQYDFGAAPYSDPGPFTGSHLFSTMAAGDYPGYASISNGSYILKTAMPVSVAPASCGGLTPTIGITAASISLNFGSANSDTVSLTGFLPVAKDNFYWHSNVAPADVGTSATVAVTIGSFTKTFVSAATATLPAKTTMTKTGQAVIKDAAPLTGTSTFTFVLPTAAKTIHQFPADLVKFTVVMSKQSVADALYATSPQLVNQTILAPGVTDTLSVQVTYTPAFPAGTELSPLAPVTYTTTVPVIYTCTEGKTGLVKKY